MMIFHQVKLEEQNQYFEQNYNNDVKDQDGAFSKKYRRKEEIPASDFHASPPFPHEAPEEPKVPKPIDR